LRTIETIGGLVLEESPKSLLNAGIIVQQARRQQSLRFHIFGVVLLDGQKPSKKRVNGHKQLPDLGEISKALYQFAI
jgi:hypothetical protein